MVVDHLVLAGGGHSHALILLRWAMNPHLRPFGLITLVNRSSSTLYSGMLPGVIAGQYTLDEISIDLRTLALKTGVAFVKAEILGIDLLKRHLTLEGRPAIEFSVLSLNIGSETNFQKKNFFMGDDDLICPIKPFHKALEWISNQDVNSESSLQKKLAVFGGGLGILSFKKLPLRENPTLN